MEAGALQLPLTKDDIDGELTNIGRIMANFPLDPPLSRLIFFSMVFGCVEDGIILAACLSSRSFMDVGMEQDIEKYKIKVCLSEGKECYLLAALRLFRHWKRLKADRTGFSGEVDDKDWCRRYSVSHNRINETTMLVDELKARVDSLNMLFPPEPEQDFGGWQPAKETVYRIFQTATV